MTGKKGISNWEFEKMVDQIIQDNIKEVQWEGTQVDKTNLKQDFLELLKDVSIEIGRFDKISTRVSINGIPVGTSGVVTNISDDNREYKIRFSEAISGLKGLGEGMELTFKRCEIKSVPPPIID